MEVRVLADAFNAMLERLEESFGRLSRFSAGYRSRVEDARKQWSSCGDRRGSSGAHPHPGEEYVEVMGSCLEESVRLTELIESLLFLARSESPGDHLKRTREDLGRVLADLRDYYRGFRIRVLAREYRSGDAQATP